MDFHNISLKVYTVKFACISYVKDSSRLLKQGLLTGTAQVFTPQTHFSQRDIVPC